MAHCVTISSDQDGLDDFSPREPDKVKPESASLHTQFISIPSIARNRTEEA
jgi:hypothetical protein